MEKLEILNATDLYVSDNNGRLVYKVSDVEDIKIMEDGRRYHIETKQGEIYYIDSRILSLSPKPKALIKKSCSAIKARTVDLLVRQIKNKKVTELFYFNATFNTVYKITDIVKIKFSKDKERIYITTYGGTCYYAKTHEIQIVNSVVVEPTPIEDAIKPMSMFNLSEIR